MTSSSLAQRRPVPDGWAYRSAGLRALDLEFGVRASDAVLGRYLDDVLVGFRAGGEPVRWYSILVEGPASEQRWKVYWGDEELVSSRTSSHALAMLFWHLNTAVVEASGRYVLIHSAVAELDGRAVLLIGPAEAGKTTLVAGLVGRGLRYMSDEIAAIDPVDGSVVAYPKPLSIDPGSWGVLAGLRPVDVPELAGRVPAQWVVPVERIRPGAIASRGSPGLILHTRFDANATTRVTPVARSDMLLRAAGNTFELSADTARDLEVLAGVVARSRCYELVYQELDEGCAAVLELLRS